MVLARHVDERTTTYETTLEAGQWLRPPRIRPARAPLAACRLLARKACEAHSQYGDCALLALAGREYVASVTQLLLRLSMAKHNVQVRQPGSGGQRRPDSRPNLRQSADEGSMPFRRLRH